MAWAKALVDLSNELIIDGESKIIPLESIAKKYIKYYWNQTIFFDFIQSSIEEKAPAIITITKKLIDDYYQSNAEEPVLFDVAKSSIDSKSFDKTCKEVIEILKKDVSYRFLYLDRNRTSIYQYSKGNDYIIISSSLLQEIRDNNELLTAMINYRWGKIIEAWNSSPRISKKIRINEQEPFDNHALEKYAHWIDLTPLKGATSMALNRDIEILKDLEEKYKHNESDSEVAADYADQLFHCFEQQLIDSEKAYKPLVSINLRFPRIERINLYLSQVLTPSYSDSIDEILQAMDVLDKSFYSNPEHEVIAESYAIALWLYAQKNNSSDNSDTLNKLAELLNSFPDNSVINEKYHNVLDRQEDATIIPAKFATPKVKAKRIQNLTEQQAAGYAESLCNLSKEQYEIEEVTATCGKLKKLCASFPSSETIATFYVDALYDMISFSEKDVALEALDAIKGIYSNHKESEKIAELYVNAIEETISFEEDDSKEFIDVIETLSTTFDNNRSILDSFAYALYSQVKSKQNSTFTRKEAREKLKNLCDRYPENNDIHAYYSDCF